MKDTADGACPEPRAPDVHARSRPLEGIRVLDRIGRYLRVVAPRAESSLMASV